MFYFDENGRPKIMTQEEWQEKTMEGLIPNYKEVMDLNSKNFNPKPPNPHDFQHKESMNNKNSGFSVLGKKDKTKPYKHLCPPLSKEEEKKQVMQAIEDLDKKLKEKIEDLERWDSKAKNDVKKWFGSSDEISRQMLLSRTKKMKKLLSTYTINNFKPAPTNDPDLYAQVNPKDDSTIEIGPNFCSSPATGRDSKMGVLAHEMSHFDSISSTDDFEYGDDAIDLAINPIDGEPAIYNADNYEYYIEN